MSAPCGKAPDTIPWSQIGAKAGADYKGDGLSIVPTATGARLHCVFQRLDGEATREGLWLTSTLTNQIPDRFRVVATAVGRDATKALLITGEVAVAEKTARFCRDGLLEEYGRILW
jgi:hypothetical protein